MRNSRARVYALLARDDSSSTVPTCTGWGSAYDDYRGLRIASIFIILVGSMLGVLLPMALVRTAPRWRYAQLSFFVCKYFGTGIILSTSFMHLLSPAVDALADPCLADMLPDYDWAHFICLMAILTMFYIELMAARFNFGFGHAHEHGHAAQHSPSLSPAPSKKPHYPGHGHHGHQHAADHGDPGHDHGHPQQLASASSSATATQTNILLADVEKLAGRDAALFVDAAGGADTAVRMVPSASSSRKEYDGQQAPAQQQQQQQQLPPPFLPPSPSPPLPPLPPPPPAARPHSGGLPSGVVNYPPGNEDHLAHGREHVEGDSHASYSSQIVSLLILEFGVVFHSLFIGLSLAGSANVRVLLAVLAFHQFFEGLGLGSRLAVARWPANWMAATGYLMAVGYGLTTPLGIAIGLGVNVRLAARPALSQLVNGVFDAVSSGILIYTALVELMAHEFMFNPEMRDAKLSVQLLAFGCVAGGVAVMAVLAKWA